MVLSASGVYFPIEITSRELSGHLLLAAALAAEGIESIVGHKGKVNVAMQDAAVPGVVFYKSLDRYYADPRHHVVGHDPEAGISYSRYADFFSFRPPGSLESPGVSYFCFGDDDHSFLKTAGFRQAVATGSPRASLWGAIGNSYYQHEVGAILERYESFVLFTSSGTFPHEKYAGDPTLRKPTEDELAGRVAESFAGYALEFARDLQVPVVIRPHPSDSWYAWKKFCSLHANLFLESAFDLSVWTRCASAVVHPGTSTSAIESVCSGTPAISTGHQESQTIGVPNSISHDGTGSGRLVSLLERSLARDLPTFPNQDASQLLEAKILHPLEGAAFSVARTIADNFKFRGFGRIRKRGLFWSSQMHPWNPAAELGATVERPFKKDPLSRAMVEMKLDAAKQALSLAQSTRVEELAANCFRISPAS